MAAANKLMLIGGIILFGFAIFYVIFLYIALLFIATEPSTIAMLSYFLLWMWYYLIFSTALFVVAIVVAKKENSWAIGGVSIGVTALITLYHLYFTFRVCLPYLILIPPAMTMVVFLTILIYTILIVLALIGGIIKIATAGSSGA